MGTFHTFEEIDAWQGARQLTRQIYQLTRSDKLRHDFALVDQLRRSGISIMANIAEGFERSGTREFIQFLSQAKGSAGELCSHLYVLLDQEFISTDQFTELYKEACHIEQQLEELIQYLKRSSIKGAKFPGIPNEKTPHS